MNKDTYGGAAAIKIKFYSPLIDCIKVEDEKIVLECSSYRVLDTMEIITVPGRKERYEPNGKTVQISDIEELATATSQQLASAAPPNYNVGPSDMKSDWDGTSQILESENR